MENNTYEQEIDLKDLMFAVLHRWRPVIVIAVLVAMVLGGFKAGKGFLQQRDEEYVKEVQEKYDEDVKLYKKTKSNYEQEIVNIKANLEYQEEYLDKSVLLQISPYNKCVASADVFIRTESEPIPDLMYLMVDYANSIVKAYTNSIQQGDTISKVAKKMGMGTPYLKELISVSPDYNSNMFSIQVIYTDKAGAEKVLDAIISDINSEYGNVSNRLGEHTVSVMNKNVTSITDLGLEDIQKSNTDKATSLQSSLENTQKALEGLKEPDVPMALSGMVVLKTGIKYAVLGGVLGAFMTIFCICVFFLMSDKMNSDKELKNRFGMKILGAFVQRRKKRAFVGIDRWLDKKEGKALDRTDDFVYELIGVNINNYANGARNVMVTGTVGTDELTGICDKLEKMLPGISLTVGADMNENASTLQSLPDFDALILVEKSGASYFTEIQTEVETAYNLKKEIIGCIVL